MAKWILKNLKNNIDIQWNAIEMEIFLRCKTSYRAAKSSYTKNKWEKCRLPPELSKTIRRSIRSNDWTHSPYLKPILKEMSREIWIQEDSVKFA